ncbi:MAG: hypothetical protein A3D31_08490 [Candidatus Fluviicola riflensis]|nr:MAG: hypothetical protein CHH17_06505 [Candidatus Fluviicola riflensis]OGS79976.1 MAG: hypothetical protein A3D31_08490 [Candidatus Fluviicola riflensis]OGS82491.1 MAG: hypothetical protein A2724_17435 [Fluviicola sp. RIFCSPHIGHO2_01_FULL_43_53]OGS88155.1 MAG: hypothetical protein A3E30_14870 [Fluviicola sp. RIFCSPHIGHO2_12_FULL_43_24]
MILVPKHYYLFSIITQPVQKLVFGFNDTLFGELPYREDSSGMYLLILIAPVLGFLFGLIAFLPVVKRLTFRTDRTALVVMRYYLVLELWEYGWIKLTKMQFYLPEPNTVYTQLGALSKDIAYWSVMGSSPSYVIFMGVMELIAGSLIVIKRTRFIGLLLALGIFINVVMVNFSFDISVKLFSISLLFFTVVLLLQFPDQWRMLLQLPVKSKPLRLTQERPYYRWGRALVLSLFVVESVYPSIITGSMNDDDLPRPDYHGAYSVAEHSNLTRVYVHRQDYVIFENKQHDHLSLKIVSKTTGELNLIDEETKAQSKLSIRKTSHGFWALWQGDSHNDTLFLRPLPYRELPLVESSFHWFSDEYH